MPLPSARVADFVRECQRFAGESSLTEAPGLQVSLVREFVTRLPDPADRLEALLFRGILVSVALEWAHHLHRRARGTRGLQYDFPSPEEARLYWSACSPRYASIFERWAIRFIKNFDRTYPMSVAEHAKQIIDARFPDTLPLKNLARMTGCSSTRLRMLFRKEFGSSLREYRTRVRVMNAAQLIAGSDLKIDAIAVSAGFRSRRNFYEAFRRITGCTPSEMKRRAASRRIRRRDVHSTIRDPIAAA